MWAEEQAIKRHGGKGWRGMRGSVRAAYAHCLVQEQGEVG